MKRTTLKLIGLCVAVAGFLATTINFFGLYRIVGACRVEDTACTDRLYNAWILRERVAIAVWILGILILVYYWVTVVRKNKQRGLL